ncbi:histidine kinase [Lactococcus hodotermopsidis]|uniref:histidine kinase n=1 Tax=Pseudolactococcus hodotermopsidis TaxID=2709157 RepID=A0A6A0B9C2_9LACT|nr:sensor histidine kinase [Lactococcus hodotermopsidis]GFH41962.1 histidine kinase [Lactococcus hodotermopsidis]
MTAYFRLFKSFCQEKIGDILAFFVSEGLIALILVLQKLDLQLFVTAFLMPLLIFDLFFALSFAKFVRQHHFLQQISVENLPNFLSGGLIEQDYQEIIAQLDCLSQQKYREVVQFDKDLLDLTKLWTHQMKVPLAALDLMAQTDHLTKIDVQNQLLELDNYLNILLSYLRLQNTATDFRFETFDVADIARDLVKKYASLSILKNLSVTIVGGWEVTSDKKWLTMALEQIINNAVKYTKTGGLIISFDKNITSSDMGIGILPEDIPRLFEHGFTGYNGRKNQKSTGLGLYLVKDILDKLDFEIKITSQVEVGTKVIIWKKDD